METTTTEKIPEVKDDRGSLSELLVAVRRHLHQNPEIGFKEYKTSDYIRSVLESNGLTVSQSVAGTGLFVDIEGSAPGPIVAYRADIDALPIQDHKSVSYRSKVDGLAHLCGHDAHTSIAIGVALLVSKTRDRFKGTVRVFFQPNEEGVPSGAPEMIRAGVLDNVEAVYAIHVDPTLPVGSFGLIRGAATAAADRFQVTVKAPSSGHSARPHQTVDTVWIATQIAQAYYQLSGRVTDARNPSILTICKFDGGSAFNVIPETVSFGGTLRCTNGADRSFLKERIVAIGEAFGKMHKTTVDVEYFDGAPPVINDATLIDRSAVVVRKLFGDAAVVDIPVPSMGAEDFAYYLEKVEGAMIRVGTSSSPETSYALHDANFDIDEEALLPASQLMSGILINHLKSIS
ncbi:MAG: amidohydrolase [Bacteroidetes bacterium]|nr:amidohydrolase [Bacteroidota bacterium]